MIAVQVVEASIYLITPSFKSCTKRKKDILNSDRSWPIIQGRSAHVRGDLRQVVFASSLIRH